MKQTLVKQYLSVLSSKHCKHFKIKTITNKKEIFFVINFIIKAFEFISI